MDNNDNTKAAEDNAGAQSGTGDTNANPTNAGVASSQDAQTSDTADTLKDKVTEAGNTFSGVIDDIGAHHEKKESLTEEVLEHLQEAREAVEKIIEKLLKKL